MTAPAYLPQSSSTRHSDQVTEPEAAPAKEPDCPACPHPQAEHDVIGARFCRATIAGAFDRGCVCRPR
jgi:hypothetical protein